MVMGVVGEQVKVNSVGSLWHGCVGLITRKARGVLRVKFSGGPTANAWFGHDELVTPDYVPSERAPLDGVVFIHSSVGTSMQSAWNRAVLAAECQLALVGDDRPATWSDDAETVFLNLMAECDRKEREGIPHE